MSDVVHVVAVVNSDGKSVAPWPDTSGVRTDLHDLRLRILARTPYEHLVTELSTVSTAERALALGCDAIMLDTFGDYGLDRIRAISNVPVVGAGESSIRAAADELGRFSIVTVWPRSMAYLYADRLTRCEGGDACVGVHHLSDEDELDRVGRDDGVRARMVRHDGSVLEQVAALCERAVDEDGSDGVLLGCTCMQPIAARLAERLPFPVLDPSAIAHAEATAAATQPYIVGSGVASDQAGLASALVESYLETRGGDPVTLGQCEVCAIG